MVLMDAIPISLPSGCIICCRDLFLSKNKPKLLMMKERLRSQMVLGCQRNNAIRRACSVKLEREFNSANTPGEMFCSKWGFCAKKRVFCMCLGLAGNYTRSVRVVHPLLLYNFLPLLNLQYKNSSRELNALSFHSYFTLSLLVDKPHLFFQEGGTDILLSGCVHKQCCN
jgi:hypothetical protein